MAKTNLFAEIQRKLIKNALPAVLGGVVTTVTAYIVDVGLLDGQGADAFATLLLQIATNAIGLMF